MLLTVNEKPPSLRAFEATKDKGDRGEIRVLLSQLQTIGWVEFKRAAFSNYLRLTAAGQELLDLIRDEGAYSQLKQQLETGGNTVDLAELKVRLVMSKGSRTLAAPSAPSASPLFAPASHRPKIFLAHGHDVDTRQQVTVFLERQGIDVIALDEQHNAGKTVIEKFEDNSDVDYAVVLMTGDDVGGKTEQELRRRPRQNVVFELGFFMGRLKRDRVCALKGGDVELPSDIGGMVWLSFEGKWRKDLAIELEKAGYPIDWRKLVE